MLPEDYALDLNRVALLITDAWRPASNDKMRRFKDGLRRHKIRFADVRDFAIDPKLLMGLLSVAARVVRRTWKRIGTWRDLELALRFLRVLLQEEVVLAHCDVKAIVCRDDYASRHVVRTLLFRQRGVRTLGIQHSAGNGLHGVPTLAYVCFDRYLIVGLFFRDLFRPYWDDVTLAGC